MKQLFQKCLHQTDKRGQEDCQLLERSYPAPRHRLPEDNQNRISPASHEQSIHVVFCITTLQKIASRYTLINF